MTRRPAPGRARLWIALGLAAATVAACLAQTVEFDLGLRRRNYAVPACDWILEHRPQGRLYNTNGIGSYLVYRLAPRSADGEGYRVYSDGRMPMFYAALQLQREFSSVEARYAPEILVVD